MRSTFIGLNRLALTAILLASYSAKAEGVSSVYVPAGGSCVSQGSWTQKALEQTDSILATLNAMQNDENCKSVVDSIGSGKMFGQKVENTNPADLGEAYRAENIMQELSALRDVLVQKKNSSAAAQLSPVLAEATVNTISAISAENDNSPRSQSLKALRQRAINASSQGATILNTLFQVLPAQQKCMQKRPDLAAALVLGGVKIASAFAVGDIGMTTQMAEMTSNFLRYLKDVKFATIEKNLNEQKVWSEISCLVESTQASYCAVQDGLGLINIQKKYLNQSVKNSPLEGFYLMSREVLTVTDWLDKIRAGVITNREDGASDGSIGGADNINLSDESVVGTTESVRSSLENVRSYLTGLYRRLKSMNPRQPILASIVDTMIKVDRILAKFKALDKEAQEMGLDLEKGTYNITDLSQYSEEERNAHLQKFKDLITTTYTEFNMKNQDSSLFSGRLATYVRYEYEVRLKHEDFSQYTNQLVVSARGTVEEKLKEYQKFNIAEAQADLAHASDIQLTNLDNLEELTGSFVEDYLVHLNNRAGNKMLCSNGSGIFTWDGLRKMIFGPNCSSILATRQDTNNEAEILRGKVCLQTLGFKGYTRFSTLCKGAVLKSIQSGKSIQGLPLEYRYDDLFRQRYQSESWMIYMGRSTTARSGYTCLLRDYFRNNFVNWLTMKYQQNK